MLFAFSFFNLFHKHRKRRRSSEEPLLHDDVLPPINIDITKQNTSLTAFNEEPPIKQPNKSTNLSSEDGIVLSDEQASVINLLETSTDNYFVTGKAGTGKSVVLRTFLKNTKKKAAVLAPTGIAAINVNGQTIHSFFGLEPALQNPYDKKSLNRGLSDGRKETLKHLDTIIIDEISMVRVDVLDMIDARLQAARNSPEPFGGCQMIVFGDLYQLPPVTDKDGDMTKYLKDIYHTIYFFGAPACRKKPFKTIELSNVYRQKDPTFISILNHIRVGEPEQNDISTLNTRIGHAEEQQAIVLTSTNQAAQDVNQKKLNSINTPLFTYIGKIEGNFKKEDLPTDYVLKLKVGAQIMFVKNSKDKLWVNGTLGTIVDLSKNGIKVKIKQDTYSVSMDTWEKHMYRYNKEAHRIEKKLVGSFMQYPIKLAYAITIHKSQGQTYDAVKIDYSANGAFASGQTYVALSRCKSFDKLYLTTPISLKDIFIDQEIAQFMSGELKLPPIEPASMPLQVDTSDKRTAIETLPNGCLKAYMKQPPKKITGRRLPAILGYDRYNTPFKTWCIITHAYQEPFQENQYTTAGKLIQPKQFEYIKSALKEKDRTFVEPADLFGDDPEASSNYDFFSYNETFGGMWDYLIKDHDKISAVVEMKTKKATNQLSTEMDYPKDAIMQACLYAYLQDIKDVYMVTSYVSDEGYAHPENYFCTPENTTIHKYNIDDYFHGFQQACIDKAQEWWDKYVLCKVSPPPVTYEDQELLRQLLRGRRQGSPSIDAVPTTPLTEEDLERKMRQDYYSANMGVIETDTTFDYAR